MSSRIPFGSNDAEDSAFSTRLSIIASVGFLFVLPYLMSGFHEALLAPFLLIGLPLIGLSALVYSIAVFQELGEQSSPERNRSVSGRRIRRGHAH